MAPSHPDPQDFGHWPPSYWAAAARQLPDHAPLCSDRRADLAIVGGGYTGLNAALEAATRGADTVLLDAAQPGWGASGRNGGFACLGGTRIGPAAILHRFGKGPAAELHRFQLAAVDHVAGALATHGIDAGAGPAGELCLAHRPAALPGLREEADFMNRAHGLGAKVLGRDALRERGLGPAGFAGAVLGPVGFPIDPMAYAAGLARAASRQGVALHGQSPVIRMVHDGGGWRLFTPGGSVRARRVILAMNAYAGAAFGVSESLLPVPTSIIVTRALTPEETAAQNWHSLTMAYDSRRLLHYFRRLPDGRFLFGMRGGFGADAASLRHIRARIGRHFKALFPEWVGVETPYFWSGLIAMTARALPYIGPVPGRPGLFAAFGYHGNGVAMGSLAGDRVAGQALGDPVARVPALLRLPLRRLPLPGLQRAGLAAAFRLADLADGPLRA